jgi:hypothetical protein
MARPGAALPNYVSTVPAANAYRAALASPAAMQSVKCYCGCDKFADPHRSLYDCFVARDGTYADHGATCGICQAEAVDAHEWATQGVALNEISARIDRKYGTAPH